jgi:two-component system chemotaxis response regulator CheB
MPDETMVAEDTPEIIAIAASAGGLSAIEQVLEGLPADFPAAILIVQHLDPAHRSHLAEILSRHTRLAVQNAKAEERPLAGHVYVAPPGRHLIVDADKRIGFSDEPVVHFVRPSADVLFESLAMSYGTRALVVILSGTGSDGSGGAAIIKKMGGRVVVEDPETAEFPGMPKAALLACEVDQIVPLARTAQTLRELVGAREP